MPNSLARTEVRVRAYYEYIRFRRELVKDSSVAMLLDLHSLELASQPSGSNYSQLLIIRDFGLSNAYLHPSLNSLTACEIFANRSSGQSGRSECTSSPSSCLSEIAEEDGNKEL